MRPGRVLLATGERREVSEIAKGDRLLAAAPGGGAAVEVVVDRVVETRFGAEQLAELVDLGDGVRFLAKKLRKSYIPSNFVFRDRDKLQKSKLTRKM